MMSEEEPYATEPDDDELLGKRLTKGKPAAKKPRPSAGSSKAPAKVKEEKEKPSMNDKGKANAEMSKKFEFVSVPPYLLNSDCLILFSLAGQLLKRPN